MVAAVLGGLMELGPSAYAAALSPISKGPYLQELGPTSVVVRVEVDPPASVDVEVSPVGLDAAGPVSVKHDPAASAFHSVLLDQLQPASRYSYLVKVAGVRSREGTFTTAPAPDSGAPFTFLVYGDDRSGDEAHASIVHSLLGAPSDFLVHTGDFVEDGSARSMWQTFFDIEAPLLRDRCVFACVGNHELVEPGGISFARYFGPTDDRGEPEQKLYQTFRWSSARFFLLNGMDTWATSNEKKWLRDELTKADAEPGISWRIVVVHYGPWSSGPHGKNARLLGAGIVPLLVEHKVDLVLSGHDHIYERGEQDGLRYVVSGGGGAPLYPIKKTLPSTRKAESAFHYLKVDVTSDACAFVATRDDGSVLDRCGFKRASAEWDCDPAPPLSPPHSRSPTSSETPGHPETASRCGCEMVGLRDAGTSYAPLVGGILFVGFVGLRRRRS